MAGSIDTMFESLVVADTWASTIAGFILIIVIVFGALAVFGRTKTELGAFGIMLFAFLGALLATIIGLFTPLVLLLFTILSLMAILMKNIFFHGGSS